MSSDWMREFKGKVTSIMDEIVIEAESEEEARKIVAEISARIMGTACEYTQQAYMDGVQETQKALQTTGIEHGARRRIAVTGHEPPWIVEIPWVLWFPEGEHAGGYYFWDPQGYRCPEKGEFYVTPSANEAYVARKDMKDEYLIVKQTCPAKKVGTWRRKDVEEYKEEG
jgi:hypothetical protein